MIRFEKSRELFHLDDTVIGKGTTLVDASENLSGQVIDIAGQTGWTKVVEQDSPVSYSFSFKDGILHSGFFWAHVPSDSKDWNEADRVERDRRMIHERMMQTWLGNDQFLGSTIKLYLIRDPRSYLEEIFFEVLFN